MSEIRCYAVVTALPILRPSRNQWSMLFEALSAQFDLGINRNVRDARHRIAYGKVSQGTGRTGASALFSFELAEGDVQRVLSAPDSHLRQFAGRNDITEKDDAALIARIFRQLPTLIFQQVPDLRTRLEWSAANVTTFVNGLTVQIVGYGDAVTAKAQVQHYLRDHAADWYAA